ncbi:MAG: hypothetical protein GVY30_01250 [Chloroflexi bacterium]|jgi:hypothetical protein|nr:hypothetical protein [Chloroflexota bacterium]
MTLIPFKRLTLRLTLPPDEAAARLARAIDPDAQGRMRTTHPPARYQGYTDGRRFQIRRVLNYQNLFTPTLHGRIFADEGESPDGSLIQMTIYPRPTTLLMVAAYAFLTAQIFIQGFQDVALIPAVVISLFGYTLLVAGFRTEVTKAQAFLEDVFQGYISPRLSEE